MTIPDDVRDVIMEALSVLLGRQDFEGEPSERTVNAMNWLEAQPAERWEPVHETVKVPCTCGCGHELTHYADGSMAISGPSPTRFMPIALPDNLRLFRRAAATVQALEE